ncbi:MAG: Xaa-Pro peptidase family protein [Candidatus Palauibacterales bacterium]|nr:Xaa-Pro peptidase family protein [Candidatus Palauibacterales bacterium]
MSSESSVWAPRDLRLRLVRDRLHEASLEALLVSHMPSIRWLTGFTGSSGFLLVEPGSATLITDFRYEAQASEEVCDGVSVAITATDLFAELARCLDEGASGPRVGFEDHVLTVKDRRALGESCGAVTWEAAGPLVDELRSTKDPGEIEAISRAVRMAESALSEVLGIVTEGMTETELAAELVYRLRRAGSETLPFDPIVASGPRSALPHAHPGERKLREGDFLLLDFGARVDGYCSDMTRTFVLGSAARWQREVHGVVAEAVERAIAAACAGATAQAVDRAARDVIVAAGYGDRFGHGTGHGVGLEVHERPSVNARSRETLASGNVVTIEPAVYLPGRGGVRLEEVVVAGEDGAAVLTGFPRDLREL